MQWERLRNSNALIQFLSSSVKAWNLSSLHTLQIHIRNDTAIVLYVCGHINNTRFSLNKYIVEPKRLCIQYIERLFANSKHIFWWLPHQLCIPRSLLLMVWPFFLCRPYKDKKQYRLACINFVCLIVHMYLECEFAFSSSWIIHSIRYNMFVLKKSVAHAFTVFVFPSYLVYTNSVYTWSLAYFFLKIIPKRELLCRTLHTTHRIADRQFFMILYNYTYTVILSWYVFFVKFFFFVDGFF